MPLVVGLAPDGEEGRVLESLVRRIEKDGRALTAGDIGFHYVVEALSRAGRGDLLFAMNARDDVPGYGFQLKKGATALTESWAALEEVSNNHLMLGHLMRWFYSGLLGIDQAEASVGYASLVLKPQVVSGLEWARGEYRSPARADRLGVEARARAPRARGRGSRQRHRRDPPAGAPTAPLRESGRPLEGRADVIVAVPLGRGGGRRGRLGPLPLRGGGEAVSLAPHLLLALALSTLIGVSLGLLGGGGSTLALPVLVYVARVDVHTAIGLSLAVVGATALVGGVVHARAGRVDLRAAALFGGSGMLGAPLGAQVTHAVAPRVLMLLFALLMLAWSGTLMLRGRGVARPGAARPHPLAVARRRLRGRPPHRLPRGRGGLPHRPRPHPARRPAIHRAIGTSLLVIAANSAAGVLGHLRQGELPLGLAAAFTAAAALGALAGVRLATGLDPARLRRAFAVFVILVGLFLLAKNAFPG